MSNVKTTEYAKNSPERISASSGKFVHSSGKETDRVLKGHSTKKVAGSRYVTAKRTISFGRGAVHTISATDKISMIKEGISKNNLNELKDDYDFDYDTLSKILSVSRATLINKKGDEKFDQNTSERIMHLKDVIDYGESVFEDKNAFNEWLKKSNLALGGKTPLELMDTIYGIEEVKREIGRIEYGVF